MINNKVLITVPHLSLPGGVTGLFNLLKLNKLEGIEYFSVNLTRNKWSIFLLPLVYFKFILKLLKIQVVHINPSLNAKSFYRDMVFAFIAKQLFKRKTIIYWHGWEDEFFFQIKKSRIKKFFLCKTFGKADVQLVLAMEFVNNLKTLGCQNEILLESNVTEKLEFVKKRESLKSKQKFDLLFISRITKNKGWDIAINTMKILSDRGYHDIILTIAGDGDCLKDAKALVTIYNLKNVLFTGYVSGNSKVSVLNQSDILFFPTCYGEGMPITILEGMMYGMPIISRNIGGIPDHVKNGINGLLTDSINPENFATMILKVTEDFFLFDKFSTNNFEKARSEFIPERLINRLLTLYNFKNN